MVTTTERAAISSPPSGDDAGDAAHPVEHEILGAPRQQRQAALLIQNALNRRLVEAPIGLRPWPAHGRPLRSIENPELNAGAIDGAAHDAVQGVDFAHDLPLCQAADGRIARHLADTRQIVREQKRGRAEPGRRGGRLAPGVPAADYDDVVSAHGSPPSKHPCFT